MKSLFTTTQWDFILNYTPANAHFTSPEEMEKIAEVFGFKHRSYPELKNLRDNIVTTYTAMMDNAIIYDENGEYQGRTKGFYRCMSAMQSITVVIDHEIYKF